MAARTMISGRAASALLLVLVAQAARGHGDVNPQPVDTAGLEALGESWRSANPYRGNKLAIQIGKSAYNQQCARCHGLEGISGGMAPDLRYLPKDDEGDKIFLGLVRRGAFRDGRALMPKYEGVVSQEGMWAIRSWLDTVYAE
ncbi:MAG TPA: cytochrome c-550 PedF [Gemmatimonadales bacterium]